MSDDFAARIVQARRSGAVVAGAVPPLDVAAGYRIAALVQAELGAPAGWKVGATNAAGQRFLGTGEPICGRMFAGGVYRSPAALDIPGQRNCEVEPEIVLEVGAAGEAVRAFLGVEVNRPSRDDAFDLGAGFIVADNAAHVALVLGPELPLALLDDPAAVTVKLEVDSEPVGDGNAAAVLGDPRRSAVWLGTQVPLSPGALIAAGAMCRAAPFAAGSVARADFGALGEVVLEWRRKVMAAPPE